MATSHIPATPGVGVNAATHTFTEDAVTKHAQRIVENTPAGVDAAFGAGAVNTGTRRVVHALDDLVVTQTGSTGETAPATDIAAAGLNGRMQRVAQRLTSLIALLPGSLGAKAAAASLSVTASTDDAARWGALTETAPGTDTASAGLNGRLQRVAQRLTTVETQLAAIIADASVGSVIENAPASDTASSGLNGRLQRVAQRLTTISGQFSTILADDSVGLVNETVPATDTASSGLNGRLQRVAQHLTVISDLLTELEAASTASYDATAEAERSLLVDTGGIPLATEADVPIRGDLPAGDPSVTPFPVLTGGDAVAHGANPTAFAAGERTKHLTNRAGIPFVMGGHPNVIARSTLVADADGAQTNVSLLTISAGTKIVLTRLTIMASGANTVNTDARVGFGATTVPTPALVGVAGLVADGRAIVPGSGVTMGDGSGILAIGADGEDLRLTCSDPTGGHLTISYSYYTIES